MLQQNQVIHLKLLFAGDPGTPVVEMLQYIESRWGEDKVELEVDEFATGVVRAYFAGTPPGLGTVDGCTVLLHMIAYGVDETVPFTDAFSDADLAQVDGVVYLSRATPEAGRILGRIGSRLDPSPAIPLVTVGNSSTIESTPAVFRPDRRVSLDAPPISAAYDALKHITRQCLLAFKAGELPQFEKPSPSELLARERARRLRGLGHLQPEVLGRLHPLVQTEEGTATVVWPSQAVGRLRLVWRDQSVLLVTDGISDPWDAELNPDPPPWTFGFEACLEVPRAALPPDVDGDWIAQSWLPALLWAVTDWVVYERRDVKGMLIKFGCVTLAAPPVAGLEHLVGLNGSVGVLLGVPFVGTQLEHQAVLAPEPHDPEDAVWLLPLKLLTPDEYAWVMEDEDGGRAKLLAQHFLGHDRHSSWPTRPSALPLDETA